MYAHTYIYKSANKEYVHSNHVYVCIYHFAIKEYLHLSNMYTHTHNFAINESKRTGITRHFHMSQNLDFSVSF